MKKTAKPKMLNTPPHQQRAKIEFHPPRPAKLEQLPEAQVKEHQRPHPKPPRLENVNTPTFSFDSFRTDVTRWADILSLPGE